MFVKDSNRRVSNRDFRNVYERGYEGSDASVASHKHE